MLQYIEKTSRIIVKLQNDNKVVIPSRMFPLESKPYRVINTENTENVIDKEVIRIFDSIEYEIGHCFSNSKKLTQALLNAGYQAKQYVGWVFTYDYEYPIHHSFVMLDSHILDISIEFLSKDMEEMRLEEQESPDKARELIIQWHNKKKLMKNHEKCNFGKCDNMYVYVGAEGKAEQGIERNRILRQEYPDHPSFADVKNGITKTQQMMMQLNIK